MEKRLKRMLDSPPPMCVRRSRFRCRRGAFRCPGLRMEPRQPGCAEQKRTQSVFQKSPFPSHGSSHCRSWPGHFMRPTWTFMRRSMSNNSPPKPVPVGTAPLGPSTCTRKSTPAFCCGAKFTVVSAKGETLLRMTEGDTIVERVNQWHHGVNAGEEPAEILVFYAGVENSPITVVRSSTD